MGWSQSQTQSLREQPVLWRACQLPHQCAQKARPVCRAAPWSRHIPRQTRTLPERPSWRLGRLPLWLCCWRCHVVFRRKCRDGLSRALPAGGFVQIKKTNVLHCGAGRSVQTVWKTGWQMHVVQSVRRLFFILAVSGYLSSCSTTSAPIFFVPTSLPSALSASHEALSPAMSPVRQPASSTAFTAASIALASVSSPKL